jgi:hypothetical protein
MRKSEDSSYEYHGADAEKTDKANTDDGYPEAVEHNESGSVYDLKTDFIVLLPGEIIRIPQDSNLAWMTMFYALPRKLAEGTCPFFVFSRIFLSKPMDQTFFPKYNNDKEIDRKSIVRAGGSRREIRRLS